MSEKTIQAVTGDIVYTNNTTTGYLRIVDPRGLSDWGSASSGHQFSKDSSAFFTPTALRFLKNVTHGLKFKLGFSFERMTAFDNSLTDYNVPKAQHFAESKSKDNHSFQTNETADGSKSITSNKDLIFKLLVEGSFNRGNLTNPPRTASSKSGLQINARYLGVIRRIQFDDFNKRRLCVVIKGQASDVEFIVSVDHKKITGDFIYDQELKLLVDKEVPVKILQIRRDGLYVGEIYTVVK